MIVFPGEEYGDGKFDPDRVFVTYNAMGEADQSVPLPPANRRVSLNGMAIGDCLGKSAAVAKDDTWAYTLVLKGGLQHVWVGTPAEAANGVGGGRIDGIVSVAVWAATVGRKPHVSKRKPPPPPTPPNDATFWAEAEYVETCCFGGRRAACMERAGPFVWTDRLYGHPDRLYGRCEKRKKIPGKTYTMM